MFIVALVAIVAGYYWYLTNVSRVYDLDGTYCVSDEYSSIIVEFDGSRMSTYLINPDMDTIAVRVDYRVRYRQYQEDIIGNFWSDRGIEAFALRGSDVAGRIDATCIGTAIWSLDEDTVYYDREDILEMEKNEDTTSSFVSHFSVNGELLRIFNYADLDFSKTETVPEVEAELMRLLDSQCQKP